MKVERTARLPAGTEMKVEPQDRLRYRPHHDAHPTRASSSEVTRQRNALGAFRIRTIETARQVGNDRGERRAARARRRHGRGWGSGTGDRERNATAVCLAVQFSKDGLRSIRDPVRVTRHTNAEAAAAASYFRFRCLAIARRLRKPGVAISMRAATARCTARPTTAGKSAKTVAGRICRRPIGRMPARAAAISRATSSMRLPAMPRARGLPTPAPVSSGIARRKTVRGTHRDMVARAACSPAIRPGKLVARSVIGRNRMAAARRRGPQT